LKQWAGKRRFDHGALLGGLSGDSLCPAFQAAAAHPETQNAPPWVRGVL